jgi:hypothetical protein
VKSWLAYSAAFACALGAAALCYMAAFYALMSGSGFGVAGFILLAVICPVLAGLIVFGAAFSAFAKQSFDIASWAQGLAFVVVVTSLCFGLIVGDVLDEVLAAFLLVTVLFFGGRMMIMRAIDA